MKKVYIYYELVSNQSSYIYYIIVVIVETPDFEYALRDPLLYGDYRNAVNEGEPRYYEDLLDYEAIYFLFQEVIIYKHYFNLNYSEYLIIT